MASNRCAACKVNKITCTSECIFAPYFPSSNPMRFESVNKIFGAENVSNILSNLDPSQRANAVSSLCYEAEARKRDPIHGFYGRFLHHQKELDNLKNQIKYAVNELGTIVGPDRVPPFVDQPISNDFLSTETPVETDNMELPTAEAQKIVDEMFSFNEDHGMNDGHGAAGASTSAGPSRT